MLDGASEQSWVGDERISHAASVQSLVHRVGFRHARRMTDSIDDESREDLSEDERALLDERLDLERRPAASIPWEEARAPIRRVLAR